MENSDLITSFFSNEMTPEQERQFLLSVASSDSLRLELKSHAMLDRILFEESDRSTVSPSLRQAIFAQAAAATAIDGVGSGSEVTGVRDTAQRRPWTSMASSMAVAVASAVIGFTAGSILDADLVGQGPREAVVRETVPQQSEAFEPLIGQRSGATPEAVTDEREARASEANRESRSTASQPGVQRPVVTDNASTSVPEPRDAEHIDQSATEQPEDVRSGSDGRFSLEPKVVTSDDAE